MPGYFSDKIYRGPEKFVVSMDIGTTQTAVSYAHFSPGAHPQAQMVTRWPGQAQSSGAAKIPTIVSYQYGKVKACGEEAVDDLEEDDRNVARQFKLHLHPPTMTRSSDFVIPHMPPEVTVERAYADMMRYLMENTRKFFEGSTPNGAAIWSRLRNTMVIVLATPNGWDIREQAILRKAAIVAGLVTDQNATDLLKFVTEAEASVHFALVHRTDAWLEANTNFAVIDAGGSTVDTTVYECKSTSPVELREVCASDCVQAGGIFVNDEVGKMLSNKLKGSPFDDVEVIKSMVNNFERDLKPKFDGSLTSNPLKFNGPTNKRLDLGIIKNKISLSNTELASAYATVKNKIIASVSSLLRGRNVKYLLLVGGFGESPYLQKALSNGFDSQGTKVIIVGEYPRKAAAEGATIWYIKQLVKARAARATFGGCINLLYVHNLHYERKHTAYIHSDGYERVNNGFDVWVKKVGFQFPFYPWLDESVFKEEILEDTFAYKRPYNYSVDASSVARPTLAPSLGIVQVEVFAWESSDGPTWCKDASGGILSGMRLLCTLKADLSALAPSLPILTGPGGHRHYRADVNVAVYFGGTQLHAKLQWHEGGVLREGPVAIIPHVAETE